VRRFGPALLAVGVLLMLVGGIGHFGAVWAVGVVLVAVGLGALVGARSRLAGLALAVLLIAGLAVYPWLAERSATTPQAHWSVQARQPGDFGLVAAAGRVVELDGSEAYLLDAKTGRRLRNAGVSAAFAYLALDGSFFAVEHGTLTAYDRDGRRRWRRPGSVIGPFAAAGGTTLVTDRDDVRAVDAQGRVRWSRPSVDGRYIELSRQLPADRSAAPVLLPDVAVVSGVGADKDRVTAVDPRDGRVLARARTDGLDSAGPGRALLQTKLSDRECRIEIVTRSGERTSARTGCGPMVGLTTRAYVASVARVDTFDLRTGRARRVSRAQVSGIPPVTVGGERVLVRRAGNQLTAEDPATGRKLWSRGFAGERPAMSTAGGLVSVIAKPHGLNPFLSKDERKGDELIVLDARTGKERGSLVVRAGIRGTVPLGDGRVLVVGRDGAHRVVGTARSRAS
jgi:outer membrane protein assembly factor BamB